MRRSKPPLLVSLAGLLNAVLGLAACSLRNAKHDDCTSNDECAMAFGPGSTCTQG
jgi:hypothetical protein